MRLFLLVPVLLASVSPAYASSPDAWAQMERDVTRLCIKASGLNKARLTGQKASFSDTIPVELRVVRGTDRRGRVAYRLCGYDRRSQQVEVQETDGWNLARR